MQYSVFAHGTSLHIESLGAIASSTVVGWGTVLRFKAPVGRQVDDLPLVYADVELGTWCHISIPSTHATFGARSPQLESITLLVDTTHCHISEIHVYDGVDFLEALGGLKGDYLRLRDSRDVNPEIDPPWGTGTYDNTMALRRRRRLFSAVGISFYACVRHNDLIDKNGILSGPPWPDSILTFAGAGAQFYVPDPISRETVKAQPIIQIMPRDH
ncbi:hypothetical protein SAMN04488109_0601 [Chryseolinea serpens]|uniref:Uncharacterized protein n=1 Tax=Chryseolinea serpens TaxID=947013 RepID=A0A1M5KEW4_9BACT|nr:hypothetical protein SAMN04488109_0601 [Chryseolinea serpens]